MNRLKERGMSRTSAALSAWLGPSERERASVVEQRDQGSTGVSGVQAPAHASESLLTV